MKASFNAAFMRRIRFIVNFPFPDENSRAEIWRRIFPQATPTEGVDVKRLARLKITGGQILNIALSASFLAADEGVPVNMEHLQGAAQAEYDKLGVCSNPIKPEDWEYMRRDLNFNGRCKDEQGPKKILSTYPGVYVEEIQVGSKPIEGVSTNIAGFLAGKREHP